MRTSYEGQAKKLVHSLKFTHARDGAKIIAKEVARLLPPFKTEPLLVHVPTATNRVRERSFDQSALIARELSKITRLPHMHLLGRTGQHRQVGTDKYKRLEQISSAFRVLSPRQVAGKHVILIDDVYTTGFTLEAAAKTLLDAGASSVSALVFARTPFNNRYKLI